MTPSDAARRLRLQRASKLALVFCAVVILGIAHHFGVLEQLGEPTRAARMLTDLGIWGYVAFVVAYALLQPFGVPGTVFILAAPLIWPWPIAFVLSMIGTMAASVIGFSFSRFIARDWVARFIPDRFRKYDEALAKRAFATVFFLRLIFWMPPPLHAFFGVSRVGFWTHFWGSLAGYVLPLLLVSYFGQKLFDALKDAPKEAWLGIGGAVLTIAVAVVLVRRGRRASRGTA
jgi:uncharacterized membrane protein YdjX (TVP38/TMEM64 family)